MTEQESIQSLEEELRMLEEKLAARKTEAQEEKEVFRDVLRDHVESLKDTAEKQDASVLDAPAVPAFDYAAQAKQKEDGVHEGAHQEEIDALVEIALTKGIRAAIHSARQAGNFRLLDNFHDALIDDYYDKLMQSRKHT